MISTSPTHKSRGELTDPVSSDVDTSLVGVERLALELAMLFARPLGT